MNITRRNMLSFAGAALAALATGLAGFLPVGVARAAKDQTSRAIANFTKGAVPAEGGVRIEAPEIADNGGSVPIRVSADNARRIAVFNDGNPYPDVAVFTFGRGRRPRRRPASGWPRARNCSPSRRWATARSA